MKKKILQTTLSFVLTFFSIASIYAQVGVGTDAPDNTSILDVNSTSKGMLVPTMTEEMRNNIASPANGLFIFNTDESCFNYFKKSISTWVSLCGTYPPSIAEITDLQCSQITANGTYKEGVALDLSNYLTIPVTVTKAGTYTINASTTNGYYFTASGTFPDVGTYDIVLQGAGKPKTGYTAPDPGDVVNLTINGSNNACTTFISVAKANVDYAINCGAVSANGNYLINTTLDQNNTLTVQVNVTTIGFWNMETNTVNGYKFTGSGNFTSTGVQTVTLIGIGKPVNSETDLFTLTSNSNNVASSCANVPVVVTPGYLYYELY